MKKYRLLCLLVLVCQLVFLQTAGAQKRKASQGSALLQEMDRYDITFYSLDLKVSNTGTYLSGSGSFTAKAGSMPVDRIVFQLGKRLNIDSVQLGDTKTNWQHDKSGETVSVLPQQPVPAGTSFTIRVFYRGDPGEDGFFSAVSSETPVVVTSPVTWTLSEPYNAKDWFPVKEVLTDKADSAHINLTVPAGLKAGSNGILERVVDLPGNWQRYEWRTRYPVAYYLISFCVSDYLEYSFHTGTASGNVFVQNYLYNSQYYFQTNKALIDRTSELMELFTTLLGAYPFISEKYGHCQAPLGGGMEHQTMTTINDFRFWLVAHELGHSWFGNSVTCANWQDVWINEGFASYCEYLAYEFLESKTDASAWMAAAHNLIRSDPGGSVFIPEEELSSEIRIFSNRLSYKKGAALVHMIRYLFADDGKFFDTLEGFLAQYRYSTASATDLRLYLESVQGIGLMPFFTQWYYGQGYPVYSLQYNQSGDTLRFRLSQYTSFPSVTALFTMPVEIRFDYSGGDTLVRVENNRNIQDFEFITRHRVTGAVIDPGNWLICAKGQVVQVESSFFADTVRPAVWPNPCTDYFMVHFADSIHNREISLYSMGGQLVSSVHSSDQTVLVDVTGLRAGMYILKTATSEGVTSQSIVKRR